MLAYPGCWLPVFMKVIAGSWLIASVCIDLTMHSSSAIVCMCGSRSLIHVPCSPQRRPGHSGGHHGIRRLSGGHSSEPLIAFDRRRDLLAVELRERRLVIEQIDVREPFRLKEAEHAASPSARKWGSPERVIASRLPQRAAA